MVTGDTLRALQRVCSDRTSVSQAMHPDPHTDPVRTAPAPGHSVEGEAHRL